MSGVLIRLRSSFKSVTREASSVGERLRVGSNNAHTGDRLSRYHPFLAFPLVALSFGVSLALSGCTSPLQMPAKTDTTESALSGLACDGTSVTGSGTDACTVTLNAPAPAGGMTVGLSTSNSAVRVPASVVIPANASSASISATVSNVVTAQTVTLTATAGTVSKVVSLKLICDAPTMALTTSASPSSYGGPVTFTATFSASTTGQVMFTDGATSLGSSTINGTTAAYSTAQLTAGPHTITASWSGGKSSISQVVAEASPALSWPAPATITAGTALTNSQLDAASTVAGTFSYSPAAGAVLAAGTHTITAIFTPADIVDYTMATITVPLLVEAAPQSTPAIDWASPSPILYGTALGARQLDAKSTVAGTFSYTPAAGAMLPAGSHTITATFTPENTAKYRAATATVTVNVNKAMPRVSWHTPAAIPAGKALGATQLNATSNVAGSFSYSPSTGAVLVAGNHMITATFIPADTIDYSVSTATVMLVVKTSSQTAPAIRWPSPADVGYGTALSSTQLNATAIVAGTFSYLPAAGTVLAAGSHTIATTFTPADTNDYSSASATVSLNVTQATPKISWSAPRSVTAGTALSPTQLDATSNVPGTFSYSPSLGTVLTSGSHTITATFTPTDSTDYAAVTATVLLNVKTAAQTTPAINWPNPTTVIYGTALGSTQLDATSTVAGSFSYSPAAGTILAAGAHIVTATFTPTDTTDYSSASATVSVNVSQATPKISWSTPAAITAGTALSATQLDATSNVPGVLSYSPSLGTVLTSGSHTITATFTPTDSTDYSVATATVLLNVKTAAQATPAINWPSPTTVTYGTALSSTQLDATSTVAGTFSYSPAAGAVLSAGAHTLTANFTPIDTSTYSAASAMVSLNVNQGAPKISWSTPAAILAGTALSAAQLDATANVAGTFSYSPSLGTVLTSGNHTITATFTPSDSTDYSTATASVSLSVGQGTSTLGIDAASVGFGDVALNSPATQPVILTSTGTSAVTVNSAAVTGKGFTVSGPSLPVTLSPGQTATLQVQFDPTVAGAATGQLTVTSTSSTNSTAVLALSGTGDASSYAVDVSWDPPSSSADPVVGYNVYRSPTGTSTYQLISASVDSQTTYTDSTVQGGQTYDYIVESVDDQGIESDPTTPVTVVVP